MYIYIIILVTAFIIGYVSYRKSKKPNFYNNLEFFEGTQGDRLKECEMPVEIYDRFYADIYDELFLSKARQQFEALQIREKSIKTYPDEIKVLDIGCGLGHTVDLMSQYGYSAVGLDISPKMIEKAKINYPLNKYKVGDMTLPDSFEPKTFSHITCLFYSVYYVDDIHHFFENVNRWLKPEGYFIVHLVDKRKFDPVLEKSSSLIPLYNPQRYSRKTRTTLKFTDFEYTADWNLETMPVEFTEIFRFKDHDKVRQNRHNLFMYPMKKYVDTAKDTGFKLVETIDMAMTNHPFNYLFIFQKIYG